VRRLFPGFAVQNFFPVLFCSIMWSLVAAFSPAISGFSITTQPFCPLSPSLYECCDFVWRFSAIFGFHFSGLKQPQIDRYFKA